MNTTETDKTGQTWLADLPCPDCGQKKVIGYLLVDEKGRHQHTRYVCTFWQSGLKPNFGGMLHERCGWEGWTVPGWDNPNYDDSEEDEHDD